MSAGLKVLALVMGGIGLGSVAALQVDPVPKDPPADAWPFSGRAPVETTEQDFFARELASRMPPPPDGYAPSWADDDETWEFRQPAFAEWEPEPFDYASTVSEPDFDRDAPVAATVAMESPGLPRGTEIASSDPAPAEPSHHGDGRKSDLSFAGLY